MQCVSECLAGHIEVSIGKYCSICKIKGINFCAHLYLLCKLYNELVT